MGDAMIDKMAPRSDEERGKIPALKKTTDGAPYKPVSAVVNWKVPFASAMVGLCVVIFIAIALARHDWIHAQWPTTDTDGNVHVQTVQLGLATVFLHTADGTGESVYLSEMCSTNGGPWCEAATAGAWGLAVFWMAYIPGWVAFGMTLLLALREHPANITPVKAFYTAIEGFGVTELNQFRILVLSWLVLWGFLMVGLIIYASLAPTTFGFMNVDFETSFGLMRVSFLLTTGAAGLLAADILELWDEKKILEAWKDFQLSKDVEKTLYIVFIVEFMLYCLFAIERIEYEMILIFFGFCYLSSDRLDFFVLTGLGTALSVMMDLMEIGYLPQFRDLSGGRCFTANVFLVIWLLKVISLALLGTMWTTSRQESVEVEENDNYPIAE